MNSTRQIKLYLLIGVLVLLVPLSGFPQSFKTAVLVAMGALLIYFSVVELQREKFKKVRRHVHHKERPFVEHKPEAVSEGEHLINE